MERKKHEKLDEISSLYPLAKESTSLSVRVCLRDREKAVPRGCIPAKGPNTSERHEHWTGITQKQKPIYLEHEARQDDTGPGRRARVSS